MQNHIVKNDHGLALFIHKSPLVPAVRMDKRHFPLIMCCTGGGGSPLMVALPVLMGLWAKWWMAKASLVPPLLASLEHYVIGFSEMPQRRMLL